MKGSFTVDLEKAKAAVDAAKAGKENIASEKDMGNDPRAILAKLGINIDDTLMATLQEKMAAKAGLASAPRQAMIIHIDS